MPGKPHKAPDTRSRGLVDPQEPSPEDKKVKPFVGITGEHHNQGIVVEDKKENNLVKGIETEWHAAVTDKPSEVSIVYGRMVQEVINKDQTVQSKRHPPSWVAVW